MLQKRCAAIRCPFLEPQFHIRLCRCTPSPPTSVTRVTGQQAETSLRPVRSTARGVVGGPYVKVGIMPMKLYRPTCEQYIDLYRSVPEQCIYLSIRISHDLFLNKNTVKATKMDAERAKHWYPLHILTFWPQSHIFVICINIVARTRHGQDQYCKQTSTFAGVIVSGMRVFFIKSRLCPNRG